MLWALPFVALPIAIHLIHRRRVRKVAWGAMMFLLQGAKLSKGMQRLRHFLLLTLRTLAVAGLIFGLGRPLAGGWLGGMGGGKADMVLVLLDRSASMSAHMGANGESKLQTGVKRIAAALESSEAAHIACIDSVGLGITEVSEPEDLLGLALTRGSSAQASLPSMLEVALQHLRATGAGRTEIWICSDGQEGDWSPEDGRWGTLREAMLAFPAGVRVHVLNFGEAAPRDLAVRISQTRTVKGTEGARLVLDLEVAGPGDFDAAEPVPLAIQVGGARSVVPVELVAGRAILAGHSIALDETMQAGFGYVELPSDSNLENNRYYFTYGGETVRDTAIVWQDQGTRDVLSFAAEAGLTEGISFGSHTTPFEQRDELDLEGSSLLLWQGPLPGEPLAARVQKFVATGGRVIFLPPEAPLGNDYQGYSWLPEQDFSGGANAQVPSSWRRSEDLLRSGGDGTELALKDLNVRRVQPVSGDVTPLASFEDGTALLSRAPTQRGGLYFLSTGLSSAHSNLANQGVVLVAMVQRALQEAALDLGSQAQQDAGRYEPLSAEYEWLTEADEAWLLEERLQHSGVLLSGQKLVALNRPAAEDAGSLLPDERLSELMGDVDLVMASGTQSSSGLIDEVWRTFLIAVLLALICESLLCITEGESRKERKLGEVVKS